MLLRTSFRLRGGQALALWLLCYTCYVATCVGRPHLFGGRQLLLGDRGDTLPAAELFRTLLDAPTISSRLVYRVDDIAKYWDDPEVSCFEIEDSIVLGEAAWRAKFADTGGLAKLRPLGKGGRNLTITSACFPPSNAAQPPPWQLISFGHTPNAIVVESNAVLTLRGLILSDIAPSSTYVYTAAQPWRNAGIGFLLWPSIVLEPNATLVLKDVGMNYENPSQWDTCEQYNQKVLYGLEQQYGEGNVSAVNTTAGKFSGPIKISVLVSDANSDSNSEGTAGGNTTEAFAQFSNVVFNCLPPQLRGAAIAGNVRVLVAVIVPCVGILLLSAALLYWCWRKRRRQLRSANGTGKANKDLELGRLQLTVSKEGPAAQDQHQAEHRVFAVPGLHTPRGTGSNLSATAQPAAVVDRGSSAQSGGASGSSLGAATPELAATASHAIMHSSGELSGQSVVPDDVSTILAQHTQAPGELAADTALQINSTSCNGRGVTAPGTAQPPVITSPDGVTNTVSNQATSVLLRGPASQESAEAAAGPSPSSYPCSHPAMQISDTRCSTSPADARSYPAAAGATPHSTGSTGDTAGAPGTVMVGSRRTSEGRAGSTTTSGRCSVAGSDVAHMEGGTPAVRSGTTDGLPGSSSVVGGSSITSRGADAQERLSRDVPALLKARSDMAVLRDLKIGPLLGRGSYGRVYKGRWKSVTVAVKIIEHTETAESAPGSAPRVMDVGTESLLATSIAHPNVVQTYHISTMTTVQRNALAATWLQEGANSNLAASQLVATPHPELLEVEGSADSSSSSSSSTATADQKDVLETWMLMEFCEKGSLERAIGQGRFITRQQEPEMIGIYKALLDTASGLDYLHSIGVVHGDLKTANVLLKGSTRDVRGFACKITDFGLSRVLDLDATHISTRTYGTITYMPAELLLMGRMTQSTDIYSFGLMMWELYSSSRVFDEGLSIGQIFYMIAYQGWRPVIPEECPPGYAALMQACWHQDPEKRPTAQQVLRTLQKLYVAQKRSMVVARQTAEVTPAGTTVSAGGACADATPAVPRQASLTSGRVSVDSAASSKGQQLAPVIEEHQQWSYPGQTQLLKQPPSVIPLGRLGADSGIFGQGTGEPAALAFGTLAGSDEEIPTGQLFPGTYQASVGGSSDCHKPGGGSNSTGLGSGRLSGSGGADSKDEYQPWARAVSLQEALEPGSYYQRRQASRPVQGGNRSLPQDVCGQQAAEWQQTLGAVIPGGVYPAAGLPGNTATNQQQALSSGWQRAPNCEPFPADRYLPTLQLLELNLEGQAAEDNEQIPTESLYQNVSSASNICNTMSGSVLFSGNEDDSTQDVGVSGFLHMAPGCHYGSLQPTAAALRRHMAQQDFDMTAHAAAEGFVEALTTPSGVGPCFGAAPTGGNTGQVLGTYQQHSANVLPQVFCNDYIVAGAPPNGVLAATAADSAAPCLPSAFESPLVCSQNSKTHPSDNSLRTCSSDGMLGPVMTAGPSGACTTSELGNQGSSLPATAQDWQAQAAGQPSNHNTFQAAASSCNTKTAGAPTVTAAGLPPPATKAAWASPANSPFAQHSMSARPCPSPALSPGPLVRSSTPERSSTPPRPLFVYRTPSGRVYTPNPTTGVPQTVREGSGTTTATSASGPDSLRVGSVGSGTVSLHPAGSTAYSTAAAALGAAQQEAQHDQQNSKRLVKCRDGQ